jgi:hypothetical protein
VPVHCSKRLLLSWLNALWKEKLAENGEVQKDQLSVYIVLYTATFFVAFCYVGFFVFDTMRSVFMCLPYAVPETYVFTSLAVP